MARYCWQQARRARIAVVCAALLTAFVAVVPDVFAANLETLIMPGPVAEAHIEHESECVSCHARFGGNPNAHAVSTVMKRLRRTLPNRPVFTAA